MTTVNAEKEMTTVNTQKDDNQNKFDVCNKISLALVYVGVNKLTTMRILNI